MLEEEENKAAIKKYGSVDSGKSLPFADLPSALKKKKESTNAIGKIAIILVSSANADDRENSDVFLKFGFSRKFIPEYILIIVSERKRFLHR